MLPSELKQFMTKMFTAYQALSESVKSCLGEGLRDLLIKEKVQPCMEKKGQGSFQLPPIGKTGSIMFDPMTTMDYSDENKPA